MDAYKAVRVVDEKHHAKMDALHAKVAELEAKVRAQVAAWSEADEAKFVSEMAALGEQQKAAGAKPVHTAERLPSSWDLTRLTESGVAAKLSKVVSKAPDHDRISAAFLEGFEEVDHSGTLSLYLQRFNHVLLDYDDDWKANEARGGA